MADPFRKLTPIGERKQRSRRMVPERRFDTTQLRASVHGRLVHRDYAAHFFRWGHARRLMRLAGANVLDVGCGQECPLEWFLQADRSNVPARYVGVDLNPTVGTSGHKWVEVHAAFDFTSRYAELGEDEFDYAVCMEVIEHMGPDDGRVLLHGVKHCLKPGGTLLLSTPVYNGSQAANHVHEYTVDELRDALANVGFQVVRRWGTFASYPVIKKAASAEDRRCLERLREYYDDEVAACFLAPHYPDHSRNNLWVCRKPKD